MLCSLCQFDNPSQSPRCRACGTDLGARSSASGSSTPDALPDDTLLAGTYAVESVLGQGGFGITYRCHDRILDRRVAVKEFFPAGCQRQNTNVCPSRGLSEANYRDARAQFLAEARTLARCHHPGIVGVHTAFEANQTAYMVMEMLHGQTLAQLLSARGGRFSEEEAVGTIERVGAALGFVHDLELLHRDIKPDNIIACDDGRVMLIDFGTAREWIKGQAQGQTVVVTPGYAPLEQYAKQAKRGAYTDIYSLAATLYHLLTGQMPPAASDRAMGVVLRPVREVNPKIGPSVARAVESALQMEIAKRPQSVREFLELLKAPIEAPIEADDVWPHLKPAKLAEDDESSGPLLAPPPMALFSNFSEALQARQELLDGVLPGVPQPAPLAVPVVNPQPVQLAPQSQSVFSASATPSVAPPVARSSASGNVGIKNSSGSNDSDKFGWWMLASILGLIGVVGLIGSMHTTPTSSPPISYSSPPSSNFQPPFNPALDTSQDNAKREAALRAWNALPALLPASVETLPAAKAQSVSGEGGVEFSPDGKRMAYIDSQSVLRILSLPDRKVVRTLALDRTVPSLYPMFSPDNQTIAVAQSTIQKGSPSVSVQFMTRVSVWDLRTGKPLKPFVSDPQKEAVWPQAVLNNGRVLLRTHPAPTSNAKISLLEWNAVTGKRAKTPLPNLADWGYSVASPNGREFVIGDGEGRLRWLNLDTGKQKARYATQMTGVDYNTQFAATNSIYADGARLGVLGIDYSLNGSYLASRSIGEISVFDSKAHKVNSLPIDGESGMFFSMSPDGKWLAAQGSLPHSPAGMLLWNVKTGQKIRLQSPSHMLLDWGFSQDGKQLYGIFAAGEQFQFVTWQTDASPIAATFTNPEKTSFHVSKIAQSPFTPLAQVGQLIAVPTESAIEIRQREGKLVKRLNVGTSDTMTMGVSPDGQFLAVRKFDDKIQLWNVRTGKLLIQLEATKTAGQRYVDSQFHQRNLHTLAFSSDGNFFAYARANGGSEAVELWSLKKTPRRLASFAQKEPVTALTFSPDDKGLICGGEKGLVQWIDVATRQPRTQTNLGEPVVDMAFAAQDLVVVGQSVTLSYRVSASSKPSFQQLLRMQVPLIYGGNESLFARSAISADGKLFAASEGNDSIHIFQLTTGSLLQVLPGKADGEPSIIDSLAFSTDGTQLTSVGRLLNENQVVTTTYSRIKAN